MTETPLRRYVVTMGARHAGYDIHAAGCTHLRKIPMTMIFGRTRGTSPQTVKTGLVGTYAEQGWTPAMVRIMGCAERAPIAQEEGQ